MSDSAEALTGFLTFYEKANSALRIALLIIVLWPFSVVVAAIALDPATAQTVVPIVDFIPAAAVFFLIIGAPFGFMVLWRDPIAQKGLIWFIGLMGIELAVGVYFSTIPVSKDVGLVPLLILAAFAMLFLRIGRIAGFLTKILALLIIGITLIFVFGGRKRVEKQIENAINAPRNVPIFERPPHEGTPHPNSGQFEDVCQDARGPATDLDFRDYRGDRINITNYSNKCFGPVVMLPNLPAGLCATPFPDSDPEHTWSISYMFVKMEDSGAVPLIMKGPYHWTNRPEDRVSFPTREYPLTFRLKGNHAPGGGITFYPRGSSPCEAPTWPNPSTPVVSAQAVPTPIRSGPIAMDAIAGSYDFAFWPCRTDGDVTDCEGYFRINGVDFNATIHIMAIKDNLGNEYVPNVFDMNGSSCLQNGCVQSLQPNDSRGLSVKIEGVVPAAQSLALTFRTDDYRHPLCSINVPIAK
jgi:hypothetical protein